MQKHTLSTELKRAILSKPFFYGSIGMAIVIAIASMNDIASNLTQSAALINGYHAQIIINALTSQEVTLALPILCALPYTSAYVDDVKSKFIKQYLPRSGVGAYIRGKIVACGLSGGLVIVAGILLAYSISALVFTPMELALAENETAQPYLAEILAKIPTVFFCGACCSLIGLTLSSVSMSRYMAYASPFVIYYVLIILHERYFESFYMLYPKEWIVQSEPWVLGSPGVWMVLIELSAAVGLLFSITAKRRLENV